MIDMYEYMLCAFSIHLFMKPKLNLFQITQIKLERILHVLNILKGYFLNTYQL